MSGTHSFHIEKLRTNFDNIILLKLEIVKIKHMVAEKLKHLKTIYNELLKSNTKKIFLFCLDSFYFQYKTFAIELDNIDRFRVLMNNRMYCDYYKLYNIVLANIKENFTEISIADNETKSFPPYKDLEPFQEYKLEDIKDIHSNILVLINKLHLQSVEKKYNIDHYNEKHHIGFSISNFINTLEFENRLLTEQTSLYINYVSFFHISQKKQLQRLFSKMNDFYKEVEDNININQTFSIDDINEEQRLKQFYITGEDIAIENILEDSEALIENSEKVFGKIDTIIQFKEGAEIINQMESTLPEEIEDIVIDAEEKEE